MTLALTPQERDDALNSLKKYFRTELEQDLGDLPARLLLDYFLGELAPLAYNRGVQDAGRFLRQHLEDLPATCFEPPFTHWTAKKRK